MPLNMKLLEQHLSPVHALLQRGGSVAWILLVWVLLVAIRRIFRRGKRSQHRVKGGKGEDKDVIGKMWRLLCPNLLRPEADDGSWQVAAMLVLCLIRVWLMNATSAVVKKLDFNAMTRKQAEFWKWWKVQLFLALAACIHRQTYKYVENSLAVTWRAKLTRKLQGMYFSRKNYYLLAQGSAQGGDLRDPDDRIVKDSKEVATQLAHVFCEGLYASTCGTFFALKLGQLYGLRFALAPYVYLWSVFAIVKTIAPMKTGKWLLDISTLFSRYRDSVQRVIQHQEAIVALKGEGVEEETIRQRFGVMMKKIRGFHKASVWKELVEQLGYYWLLRSFMATFIIAPHIFLRKDKLDLTKLPDIAKLRGDIGHQFVLFVQSMISAGATAKMLTQLQRIGGSATRIQRFITTMQKLDEEQSANQMDVVQEGDIIEFRDVRVMTPDNTLLVDNLSFSVGRGKSLLLTGHNGAGKSSIFRCLGGLWKVEQGKITKPGSSSEEGLHQKSGVYYLPQKPYNVLGTLSDQLTYPARGAGITKDNLKAILEKVDLGYLADRDDGQEHNWEEMLSLGEQQRLAIARLIYHEPAYAILDECTSAVTGDMERRLYKEILEKTNTAYITISHRPALKAYHDQMLTIGVGEGKYSLQTLKREGKSAPSARVAAASSASQTISPKNDTAVVRKENRSTRGMWGSLAALLKVSIPHSRGKRVLLLLCSVFVQAALRMKNTAVMSEMMSAAFAGDRIGFLKLVATSVGCVLAAAGMESTTTFMERDMSDAIREGLTDYLLAKFMKNGRFYKLVSVYGSISDPQQRLADDIRDFADMVSSLIPQILRPTVELSMFSISLWRMIDAKVVGLFGVYLLTGSAVLRLSMPNFRRIVAMESTLEGKFKHEHSRVKAHAESVAFFGGGSTECAIADERFNHLLQHSKKKLWQTWKFNLVNGAIVREAPFIVQWILRNEYGKKLSDADVTKDGGVALGRAQAYIFEVTTHMFTCLGDLLEVGEKLANLNGLVSRITELDTALDHIDELATQNSGKAELVHEVKGGRLALEKVTVSTPTGVVLAKDVSFEVTCEKPLMITGHNGVGKTSLFRVLGGLWPADKGRIITPAPSASSGKPPLILVPQQVFMVTGSLADQVTYPKRIVLTESVRAHLRELLTTVGVDHLVDRHSWEEREKQWEQILSLGEQQRIGMARLFYHNPMFGVLDECTSAVSVDVEKKLYEEANRLGITCVTISQRLALEEFHKQELHIHSDSTVALKSWK